MKHVVNIIDDMQSAPYKARPFVRKQDHIEDACRRCIIDQKHMTIYDQRNLRRSVSYRVRSIAL